MAIPRRSLRSSPARIAALGALALGCSQANALVSWDEVTFYLTYASYSPGDAVSTNFTFGTKPGIDLSSFEFTLAWDNVLATPVASGPGSVADWAAALGTKGSVSYSFATPLSIKGAWTADPLGGAASLISTDYAHYVKASFAFETSPALNLPFVVSIELTNIKDATGDTVDTGSGFINWATMTPVPEPASWLGMACGMGALACLRRSRRTDTQTTATSRTG
ncbi:MULTISPECIES: PEP-CTERM sorting domain-containing protein [unclassified Roseateles]|uniref:PEP-CTERM sorting domain-containing protein n=1 Tax=unclassified Roseateles TaxID=2626991 RepID=UPI0006F6A6E6|nr:MULTISPECIES: PEP-CTERM sorting domain-containing protein [unclassified Roseateles]KQW41973.1 hypothetical protein ASC81_21920 [Pelomonas sp. Root405]KRA67576.1 hypothetical protein ASD88_23505 [Pelomonas sp. Root662]